MRKQYNSIDLMKFFCSLMVIVIHTYPFYETFPTIGFTSSNIIGRIVIPFFFVSAGYFLDKGKSHTDEKYFKKYILRLVKLYLIWSVIYIPFGIHRLNATMEISGWLWGVASVFAIFNIGTYFHLWYMAALIFAMIFCHYYLKKYSMKSLIIIGAILYSLGCLETYYGALTNNVLLNGIDIYFSIFFTTRNGLFFGILCVALGMWISKNNIENKIKHLQILTILFFIILVIEAFSVKKLGWAIDYNMYFTIIPFIIMLFCLILNINCTRKIDYRACREYSTIIYFSHAIFLELVPILLTEQYMYIYDNGAFRFFSVFIPTIIISYIIRNYIPLLK